MNESGPVLMPTRPSIPKRRTSILSFSSLSTLCLFIFCIATITLTRASTVSLILIPQIVVIALTGGILVEPYFRLRAGRRALARRLSRARFPHAGPFLVPFLVPFGDRLVWIDRIVLVGSRIVVLFVEHRTGSFIRKNGSLFHVDAEVGFEIDMKTGSPQSRALRCRDAIMALRTPWTGKVLAIAVLAHAVAPSSSADDQWVVASADLVATLSRLEATPSDSSDQRWLDLLDHLARFRPTRADRWHNMRRMFRLRYFDRGRVAMFGAFAMGIVTLLCGVLLYAFRAGMLYLL